MNSCMDGVPWSGQQSGSMGGEASWLGEGVVGGWPAGPPASMGAMGRKGCQLRGGLQEVGQP